MSFVATLPTVTGRPHSCESLAACEDRVEDEEQDSDDHHQRERSDGDYFLPAFHGAKS